MHDSFTHYRPKVYTAIILKGASLELKVNDQFNGMMLLKAKLWCLRFFSTAVVFQLDVVVSSSICDVEE